MADDVEKGLSGNPKILNSMYFYDKVGDDLFREIMAMPEYYLTRAEHQIMSTNKELIFDALEKKPFDLIEFGAGDAYKTRILLNYFVEQKAGFKYIPIDISVNILEALMTSLHQELPGVSISPVAGEYFATLADLSKSATQKKLVLFLGSNIGNMNADQAQDFLQRLYQAMNKGDLLLLGADLKKDPATILAAYNDAAGITANFNLNLLDRLNSELDADFNRKNFYHFPLYDPESGTAKSFLVSRISQQVTIKALDATFDFAAGEQIATEISQKYDIPTFEAWASSTGFRIHTIFTDSENNFADVLFIK